MSIPSASASSSSSPLPPDNKLGAKKPQSQTKKAAQVGAKRTSTEPLSEAVPRDPKKRKFTTTDDAATSASEASLEKPTAVEEAPAGMTAELVGIMGSYTVSESAPAVLATAFEATSPGQLLQVYEQREREFYDSRPEAENFLELVCLKINIQRQSAKKTGGSGGAPATASGSSGSSEQLYGHLTLQQRVNILQARYDKTKSANHKRHEALTEIPGLNEVLGKATEKEVEAILAVVAKNCPHLRVLNCDGVILSKEALATIGTMTQLTSLSFENTLGSRGIKNILFTEDDLSAVLQKLPLLSQFSLKIEDFTGSCFQSLSPSLEKLSAEWLQTIDLTKFSRLRSLQLERCAITAEMVATFPASLVDFQVKSMPTFTDGLLEDIGKRCPQLNSFVAQDCALTGATFATLPSGLQKVHLINCPVTDATLAHLQAFPLKELQLKNPAGVTGESFHTLANSIEVLILGAIAVTDDAIAKLQHLTSLRELSVTSGYNFKGTYLGKLSKTIERAVFERCWKLEEESLSRLFNKNKCLRELVFEGLEITGSCLAHAPETLQTLQLKGCGGLDAELINLSRFENLQKVELISECKKVTDAVFEGIEHLKQLQALTVAGTMIEGAFIKHLPDTVYIFAVGNNKHLKRENFKYLYQKPQLKELVFNVPAKESSAQVTQEDLSLLPETVESLIVGTQDSRLLQLQQERPRLKIAGPSGSLPNPFRTLL